MFDNFDDVLSVNDVCKALNIGKTNVYKLLKSGSINSLRVGKKYRIPKLFLIDYIYKNRD